MRITWVTRSFLDYRIPVFKELDKLCGGELTLIYNRECTSDALVSNIEAILDKRAIGMTGEFRLATTRKKNVTNDFANKGIRIPYQPGLIQRINESMPDVMVSDGFMQWTYAPLWKRMWSRKIPLVICYERTAHTERNCQLYRKLYRKWAMRFVDAYCVNGSLCGEYLQSLGVRKDKLFYGQMAADTDGLSETVGSVSLDEAKALRKTLDISGRIFLYVGQLIPRKGIMELLNAWRLAALDNAALLLVGDGTQMKELRDYCTQWSLNVFFTGKIAYKEIAKFYRIADVFVMPTLEDNWSLVVPEAMACGLPIACSKYNGCWPELVKPENGWVFDPLDKENTVGTLQSISALDTADLQKMGQCSRRIVEAFSPAKAAQAILEACQKAVANKKNCLK